jgi:iron complex outermembrane recepter protein
MKKIVLLSVIYYLAIMPIIAQSISGNVKNENGEPVPGATVKIEESFSATITNSEGYYEFKKQKNGEYNISVSILGYETQTNKIVLSKEPAKSDFILKISENLTDEVVVNALRAGKKTPVVTTEIDKSEINKSNLGQDVPYLLSLSPSVTTSSDAGTGIGYSKLSIRGTDLTRINVTVNGIPLNDAESHGVWWVDLPDLSSSVENIQIQRGVGTSTNGADAFGANINFATNNLQKEAYNQLSASYGSFNSSKFTIKTGTGLLNKHFAFDLRLSKIHSNGFIDRARTDMESLFTSGSYTDAKTLIKFNVISGQEETYQAWWGVPKVRLENDSTGMMRYLNDGLYSSDEYENMINSNSRTYNYYTYDNQIDNYRQTHYQAFASRELSPSLILNLAFNYTKGKGYYEEYKNEQNLIDYQIDTVFVGTEKIGNSDLIRRKWLSNDLYVANFSIDYNRNSIKAIIGGSFQDYFGKHYGNVIWARYASDSEINHQWYYGTGDKKEYNIFGKIEYLIAQRLNLYADLQFRGIDYKIAGNDDNLRDLKQEHTYNFFNPKVGVDFKIEDGHHIYSTFGIANREPSRTDFIDAINGIVPKHETLNDFELGYSLSGQNSVVNLNFYYMDYNNQLVKTGKINDVGDAIMTNIPNSYRKGIEITGALKISNLIVWNVNATFSKNKIKDYTEYVDNWVDGGQNEIPLGETNLSFSPEIIVGSNIEIKPFKGFEIALQSKYVGKQFIDNSSSEDRMLNDYFVNNLRFNYDFETKIVKKIELQFVVNNIFNNQYETDAWVYRYMSKDANNKDTYYNEDGYFPQAGRNFLAAVILSF